MYHYNDFEAWRGYHEELLKEAEVRRLAQQVRAARPGEHAPQFRPLLPRLVAGLLPQGK